MKIEEIKKAVQYWLDTAAHDKDTMDVLYTSTRYSDALFFGHIILEKVLKALVVKKTSEIAPFIHDLSRLQLLAILSLSQEEMTLLDEVNDFNIRARYPEQKLEFYKKATKKYADKYIIKILNLYEKLCQQAKS